MFFTDTVFLVAELIGTIAYAVPGAMVAVEKRLDLFGVMFLGVITAFGGGLIRDLILGQIPPFIFSHPRQVALAAVMALAVFFVAYRLQERYLRSTETVHRIFNIFDAIGLGVFTITGMQTAIFAGFGDNSFLVITAGLITAIGGGLTRDMIISSVPSVLSHHIYALAALAGGVLYYMLYLNQVSPVISILLGSILCFTVRMLATRYRWNLPRAIP